MSSPNACWLGCHSSCKRTLSPRPVCMQVYPQTPPLTKNVYTLVAHIMWWAGILQLGPTVPAGGAEGNAPHSSPTGTVLPHGPDPAGDCGSLSLCPTGLRASSRARR